MQITCPKCQRTFDDYESFTFCPHELIMPREDLERKMLALQILGKRVVFNHRPEGVAPARVTSCSWNGMVTIEGMPGEFSPDLFVVVD